MNKEDPQISEPSEVLEDSREATLRRAEEVAARILARQGTALESTQDATRTTSDDFRLEWEDRKAVGRSATLSTDLDDVSEVEYRQVRLERVVNLRHWRRPPVRRSWEARFSGEQSLTQQLTSEKGKQPS